MKMFLLIVALAFSGTAAAQNSERGSSPFGEGRDGSRPSDGAIKGGTILPGESGGTPDRGKMRTRCEELSGTLREDCLRQERENGAAGATRGTPSSEEQPSPPVTAPPQNPLNQEKP